jgi:spermidine synthase
VLAAFMGGLALGSRYFGQLADRVSNPVRLYGILEIGIGVYCLAAPFLLSLAREIYLSVFAPLTGNYPLRTFFQFMLAFSVLIIPTTLMGGTLPAVCRALVRDSHVAGKTVGTLYGINTTGAALGAFAVGYSLLPLVGVKTTNYLGVAANLVAGAVAWFFFAEETAGPRTERNSKNAAFPAPALPEKFLLWSLAVSGAVGMMYQIVWVRALVLVIGSSTYAFSAILVTFLLGIALGGIFFGRLRSPVGYRFFAGLQFGIAVSALLLIPLFDLLPGVFLHLFKGFENSFLYIHFIQFLVVTTVVLVPTILMGMNFPCLTGLLTREVRNFGGDLGRYYACNTVGAIAGTLLAGFLFIPFVGSQKTLVLGIGMNIAVGFAVLACAYPARKKAVALLSMAVLLPALFFPSWDRRAMASGVFYIGKGPETLEELLSERIQEILYFKEGISSTIAVGRFHTGVVALLVNGKVDASNHVDDMEAQANLANIPLLLHPDPKMVTIIGLGIGVTAGTASLYTQPVQIDVIELEPAVADASRHFIEENHRVLEDPRVRLHFDDGRSFLAAAEETYDVIISEPSNPWMAGVANLFTREFFANVREGLSPGGIFCQWLQGYSIAPEELKLVARTFLTVFPSATLWQAAEGDFLLLGRKGKSRRTDSESVLGRLRKNPRLEDAFRHHGSHSPVVGTFANFLLGPEELRAYAGTGPLNTDDRPYLEFSAPRSLYSRNAYAENRREILGFKTSSFPPFFSDARFETPEAHLRLGRYLLSRDRPEEATSEILKAFSLGLSIEFSWRQASGGMEPDPRPVGSITETFDHGKQRLSLFPRLGSHRPENEEGKDLAVWSANMEQFASSSGIRDGAGIEGSRGLLVKSIAGAGSSAYFAPLAVRPSTVYSVSFAVKSGTEGGGEAGVGLQEFIKFLPTGEQPTGSVIRKFLIGGKDEVRLKGSRNWETHSFSFRTTPRTRMVHLVFYREGKHDHNPVVFDNLRISEIR